MKTNIYYFTGTGNSLKVANDIAAELKDCSVIPMVQAIDSPIDQSAGKIGLVFPVYMWGMPLIVKRFAEKLKEAGNKYIFAVATCGGSAGATLLMLNDILKLSGQDLSAGYAIIMPGNYTPMYGAVAREKQDKMFAKELVRVKEIAGVVSNSGTHKLEKSNFLVNWILSGPFYKFSAPKIPSMDRRFRVNDKCNGCGVCAKVCPVNNLTIKDNKPEWAHKCEQCLACLQWCPQEAVQFGKNTEGRIRYHHPAAELKDILAQAGNKE